MNQQNAKSLGYEDGKKFIQGFMETVKAPFFTEAHFVVMLSAARNRTDYTYRVKSRTTANLYVSGAAAAWEACEREYRQEQEEAARRAAVEHNPNTRFCTCAACSE
jgi:hypothetical protein